MIALRNIGGPLNRFIIMTDICTSMGKSELYSQMVGVVQLEHTGCTAICKCNVAGS